MVNPKYIIIGAFVGFFLSFLIGIVSSVAFLVVLVRALIFGFIFAVLATGVHFVFSKFLDDGEVQSGGESIKTGQTGKVTTTGNKLNVTIGDERLSDEEGAPKFSVVNQQSSDNAQKQVQDEKVSAEPVVNEVANDSTQEEKQEFKPVSLVGQIAESEVNKDNVVTEVKKEVSSVVETDNSSEPPLDELPDISDAVFSEKKSDSGDIINDSEFASESVVRPSGAGTGSMNGGDSIVMAQAIRTLLARD